MLIVDTIVTYLAFLKPDPTKMHGYESGDLLKMYTVQHVKMYTHFPQDFLNIHYPN